MSSVTLPRELLERFEILSVLGEGGMGTVYRARQRSLDRVVAIKVLKLGDKADRERFRREAVSLSRLEHLNILQIYEASLAGATVPYIVTEVIEGRDLRALMDERPLGTAEIVSVLEALARALDHAHEQGIVHRDVKPENVVLAGDRVKLCDFGLARATRVGETLTQAGMIVGTPHYISPEQLLEGSASARSDQFALGAIAFELFTGRFPFPGGSPMEVLQARVRTEAPAPSTIRAGIPRRVDVVILRAMAREPGNRFASCGEFHEALRLALESPDAGSQSGGYRNTVQQPSVRSLRPQNTEPVSRIAPPARPPGKVVWVLGLSLLVVIFITGVAAWRGGGERAAPSVAASPLEEGIPAGVIARALPEPLPVVKDLVSQKYASDQVHGAMIRQALTSPDLEAILETLRSLKLLSRAPGASAGDWSWLELARRSEAQVRTQVGPMIDSISQTEIASKIAGDWDGEHEAARLRFISVLEELEAAYSEEGDRGTPHEVFRIRTLVELQFAKSRINLSIEDFMAETLVAAAKGKRMSPARLIYSSDLLKCEQAAAKLVPPEPLRLDLYFFRLDTISRSQVNTGIALEKEGLGKADRARASRVYRHFVKVVLELVDLRPPTHLGILREQATLATEVLARGFRLLDPVPPEEVRELLAAMTHLMEASVWSQDCSELLARLSPHNLRSWREAVAANPDLVPTGSAMRRCLDLAPAPAAGR